MVLTAKSHSSVVVNKNMRTCRRHKHQRRDDKACLSYRTMPSRANNEYRFGLFVLRVLPCLARHFVVLQTVSADRAPTSQRQRTSSVVLTAMHLYNLTLQPPTANIQAIVGNFSGARAQEIIVSHGTRLELLRPDSQTGKLSTVIAVDSFGSIRSLAAFRLTGGTKGEHASAYVYSFSVLTLFFS